MKNLVLIFLFITGFSYAQLPINDPTPYEVCDGPEMDGVGIFDLVSKNAEILGALSPTEYAISYHETLTDSQTGAYPLNSSYANINSLFNQQIYVRVVEIANPSNYDTTTMLLIVNAPPALPGPVPSLVVYENSTDGFANFDLTIRNLYLVNGQSNMSVSYFNSLNDAMNNNQIITTPTAFVNTTTPQTVYSRIQNNLTSCFSVTSFQIEVQEGIAITNPTPMEVCDTDQNGLASFDLLLKNAEILGSLSPTEYTISYHETQTDAQVGTNAINTSLPYNNIVFNLQNAWVRVEEIANPSNFATTSLQLIVNHAPTVPTSVSDLIVYENPYDGTALFDLTLKYNEIINTNPTSFVIDYFPSIIDAEIGANYIFNPSTYFGAHLQTIGIRITNPTTGCFSITSFILKVYDSNLVVYIPDANFKAKLIELGVDTNTDGEIQFSEALVTTSLEVQNSNISDLTGISAFTNLTHLDCNHNSITSLDATALVNVQELYCYNNNLTSLNVTGLTSLYNLYCSNNQLTSLNVNGLTGLIYLYCFQNALTTLNVTNLPILNTLYCSANQLTSISLSNLPSLFYIGCDNNLLTTLDVTGIPSLRTLTCANNQLTVLDLTNINDLNSLDFSNNSISSIDVSNQSHLIVLYCANNLLTTLDLTGLNDFLSLNCSYNQIASLTLAGAGLSSLKCDHNMLTSLDLSPFVNLAGTLTLSNNPLTSLNLDGLSLVTHFICEHTLLTELDMHSMSGLTAIQCEFNDELTYINMKTGGPQYYFLTSFVFFWLNPNLMYICCDEYNINFFNQSLSFNNAANTVQVTSYCTFVPSGEYNTITGNIKFDANNNGCDSSDNTQSNIRVDITDGFNSGATFSNALGNYTFYTQAGNFDLNLNVENPSWFNLTPTTASIPFSSNNNTSTQDFCIAPNGTHMDLEVVIAPITPARPGFNAIYKIVYRNKGNATPQFNSGVQLDFNPNQMTFVSASEVVGNQGSNFIHFDYNNLMPFESREIFVTFNINSPTATNPVNIGDILQFHSNVGLNIGDENPEDNDFNYSQIVVGSYDPNAITCIEGDALPSSEIGHYLHYVVNFENTGNYAAENVVTKVDIDATKYDINTLQVLNTSHPSYTRITGNKVEFIFEGINLEAAGGNPPVGGHGNVLFKIKSKATLSNGDSVAKRANIYFDYNAPITTNIATTTYQTLSNSIFEVDETITVYPNPTNGNVNVNSKFNIQSIELYDIQGRILETSLENSNDSTIDLSRRENGIYFLKIKTENGSIVEKIVKE